MIFNDQTSRWHVSSPWRNRLARSAVNRKVGGSSPPGDADLICRASPTSTVSPGHSQRHGVDLKTKMHRIRRPTEGCCLPATRECSSVMVGS